MNLYFFMPESDFNSLTSFNKSKVLNATNSSDIVNARYIQINEVNYFIFESRDMTLVKNTSLENYVGYNCFDCKKIIKGEKDL